MAGGLGRLAQAGLIAETRPRTYVDATRSTQGRATITLTPAEYEAAVARYHENFASDLQDVTRSVPMRVTTRLFELAHRVTGGRFGLTPGMIDLDGVSMAFALNLEINPLGWACVDAHRVDGIRRVEIVPLDGVDGRDRSEVVAAVTRVIHGGDRFNGRHRLVFRDGADVEIQTP